MTTVIAVPLANETGDSVLSSGAGLGMRGVCSEGDASRCCPAVMAGASRMDVPVLASKCAPGIHEVITEKQQANRRTDWRRATDGISKQRGLKQGKYGSMP
jgi:hypothetical protein